MSTIRIVVARSAPVAVILEHRREGGAHWSRAILWRTDSDRLEPGSWLKAKVFAEKASLSPNGALFGFFAARFDRHPKDYSSGYIAVSRPPYLTPLTLWKIGGTRGGSTWFPNNSGLLLDIPWSGDFSTHPDFPLTPNWLNVERFPEDWDSAKESGWRQTNEGDYEQSLDANGSRTLHATWEATGPYAWSGKYCYALRREGKRKDLHANQVAPLADGWLAIVRGDEVIVQDRAGEERFLLRANDDRPRPLKPPAWATRWEEIPHDR